MKKAICLITLMISILQVLNAQNAKIVDFSFPTETVQRGSTQQVKVKIKYTGSTPKSFWVGLSFAHELTTWKQWPIGWYDIKPIFTEQLVDGDEKELTFNFPIPSYLDPGQYYVVAKIYDKFDQNTQLFIDPEIDNSDEWNDNILGAKSFSLADFNSVPEGIPQQLLWATENLLFDSNLASSYHDHKKPLLCISANMDIDISAAAGIPLHVGAGGAFLVDLADYLQYTPEGQDGWITVYLDEEASLGLEVGLSEVKTHLGITWFDFKSFEERALADDRREFQLSADFKVPFLTISDIGYNSTQELKPVVKFNGSSKIGVKINESYKGLTCIEVRKNIIYNALTEAFSNNRTVLEAANFFFNYFKNLSISDVIRRGTWDDGSWELTDGAYMTNLSLSEIYASEDDRKLYGHHFFVDVPSNSTKLRVITDGGNPGENADLYVQYGERPDLKNINIKKSQNADCNESILIESPIPGRWYIMMPSISQYSDVNVKAVVSVNQPLSLSNMQCSPETGNENTDFNFSVQYYDPNGEIPTKAQIYIPSIHSSYQSMSLMGGTADNGTYTYTTKLPLGSNHTYNIHFVNESNQEVSSGWQESPKVYNSENMTIIPYLDCGVEETNEIGLRYDINDGDYKDIQLKVGRNEAIELPPNSKLDLSLSTKDNYTFNKYELKQDGETVWEYGHSGTSIQFTEFAAGTFELKINLNYTPTNYIVSGKIRNEDNSPYMQPINLSLDGFDDLTTTSTDGNYKFEGVKGGVPIKIEASGVPTGYTLNPEVMTFSNLRRDETDVNFTVSSNDNKVPIVQLISKPEKESKTNNISFSWLGSDNVSASGNILYQYKLDGYESNWTEWGNTTEISYELLNGCYKLLLRAKDEAGNYSNVDTEYEFIINGNPKIDNIEKTTNGVWATKISISKDGADDVDNNVVLKKEYSLSSDETLVPVRLYRINENTPIGAYEKIAKQLAIDTVFIKQGEDFIMKIPDDFSSSNTLEYIIEWGKEISFGWKEKEKVPQGFANITDVSPFSSDETEDRYLDRNLDLWRLATSNKRIETDDKYIYDSWTYIDKANENGIVINEVEIENLQGSWESGVRYTRPRCYGAKVTEIDNKMFVSIREDLYERTYPSGEYLNTDKERYVVKVLNKEGGILTTITGEWRENYSYSLADESINNRIWITNKYYNDTQKGLGFTIIDSNGYRIKDNFEFYTKENSHSLYNEGCYNIGNNNVLILFEDSWETAQRDDRANICYQIRSNSGELIKATTILNPALSNENIEVQDEYQVDDVITDNIGRVWISYEQDFGSETYRYYVVLSSTGNIVHGPIKVDTDIDFYICDKDNYVWMGRADGYMYLYDSDFKEYKFNRQNILIPNQKLGDLVARVDYYEYNLFDRWSSVDFNIKNEAQLKNNKLQLFHLPLNNDVPLKDVLVKLNNDEIVNISNEFPALFEAEFDGLDSNNSNLFSFSQNSLLGGDMLLTFPLVFEESLDDDGDGVMNNLDNCPDTPIGETVNSEGCSESQLDDDNDGVMNNLDDCPDTPTGEPVNSQGCSESQLDDDGDGVMNNLDNCPGTPTGESVNSEGCSESQLDDDSDGVMNNLDNCPDTPTGEPVSSAGCSESQLDDDGDVVMNNLDDCPDTPTGEPVNSEGCSESQLDDDVNHPPTEPIISTPEEGEVVPLVLSSGNKILTIRWTCTDSDNDELSYVVSISRTATGLASAQKYETTDTSINLDFTNFDSDYTGVWYCHVRATDNIDTTTSEIVKFYLDWPTSTETININNSIKVYPNPADDQLTIKFSTIPQQYSIEFYNDLGQLVIQKQSVNQLEILDLGEFPNGIYYLKMYNNKFSKTEKVIVR